MPINGGYQLYRKIGFTDLAPISDYNISRNKDFNPGGGSLIHTTVTYTISSLKLS